MSFVAFMMICVASLLEALLFEIEEEAFHHGIIPAVSLAAHALNKAILLEQLSMHLTGIFQFHKGNSITVSHLSATVMNYKRE